MAKEHEAAHGSRSRRPAPAEYPLDRFDEVSSNDRVGAHRVTAQPRVGWHFVLGGLIGAALLTTVGIVGVTIAGSTGKLPPLPTSQLAPPSTKVKPEINADASVAVLDGTAAGGTVAESVASSITDNNWGTIVLTGPATTDDVTISAVFYSDASNEAAALGLAKELGGVSSYLTTEYAESEADLVVLIGSDYAGPGLP